MRYEDCFLELKKKIKRNLESLVPPCVFLVYGAVLSVRKSVPLGENGSSWSGC